MWRVARLPFCVVCRATWGSQPEHSSSASLGSFSLVSLGLAKLRARCSRQTRCWTSTPLPYTLSLTPRPVAGSLPKGPYLTKPGSSLSGRGLRDGGLAKFGRAVALVLIMNGSVERLSLAPGFVKSLHTMQLEAETLERAEAIHFFNEGAVDVLGGLGFRVLSLTHLHVL